MEDINRLIIELKAAKALADEHVAQIPGSPAFVWG